MNTATLSPGAQPGTSLRGPGGSKVFKPKNFYGPVGVTVMAAAHVVIGYLLASGLARQAFEIVKKPLEATIVQEVKLPPPPPPPPPKLEKVQPPKLDTPPPPAFVPPPEVTPAPTAAPAPAITAVQTSQPVAPPPPAPPAPPPPAPVPAGPVKADIAVACPKQVAPEMPDKAIDDGLSGTVKAELHIQGGKVTRVNVLSGPRVFHAAVRAAASRYGCAASDQEVIAIQEFTFKVD